MKTLKNLGKALNIAEQKQIQGGARPGSGGSGCCNPANSCCTTNPPPVSCSAWGNPSCQYLYSDPSSPQHPYWTCCI